jgi:hypothetical protein
MNPAGVCLSAGSVVFLQEIVRHALEVMHREINGVAPVLHLLQMPFDGDAFVIFSGVAASRIRRTPRGHLGHPGHLVHVAFDVAEGFRAFSSSLPSTSPASMRRRSARLWYLETQPFGTLRVRLVRAGARLDPLLRLAISDIRNE